jgi:DUF3102 family protein
MRVAELQLVTNPNEAEFLAEKAGAIRALAKNVVRDVIEIGRHLHEVQDRLSRKGGGEGRFVQWVKDEFKWSRTHAHDLISLYEFRSNVQRAEHSGLSLNAFITLARPSAPEAARAEVLERAEAGEQLTHEMVKEIVEQARAGEADKYEKKLAAAQQQYERELAELKRHLQGAMSEDDIASAIDEALAPLKDKIKRLEDEKEKRKAGAPTRKNEFGLQAARINNAVRDLANVLVIKPEQFLENERLIAETTHQTVEQVSAEFMDCARTANAWLTYLITEKSNAS